MTIKNDYIHGIKYRFVDGLQKVSLASLVALTIIACISDFRGDEILKTLGTFEIQIGVSLSLGLTWIAYVFFGKKRSRADEIQKIERKHHTELAGKTTTIGELRARITQLTLENQRLQGALEQAAKDKKAAEQESAKEKERHEKAKAQVETDKGLIEVLRAQVSSLTRKQDELLPRLTALVKDNSDLRAQLTVIREANTALQASISPSSASGETRHDRECF